MFDFAFPVSENEQIPFENFAKLNADLRLPKWNYLKHLTPQYFMLCINTLTDLVFNDCFGFQPSQPSKERTFIKEYIKTAIYNQTQTTK